MAYKVTVKTTEVINEIAQVSETLFNENVEGTQTDMIADMWRILFGAYYETDNASELSLKLDASDNLIVMEATCGFSDSKVHLSQIASLEPSDENTSIQENVSDPT